MPKSAVIQPTVCSTLYLAHKGLGFTFRRLFREVLSMPKSLIALEFQVEHLFSGLTVKKHLNTSVLVHN